MGSKWFLFIFTPILVEDSHLDKLYGWNHLARRFFFVSAGRIEGKVPFFSGIDARIGKESNPGNSANVTFLGWIGGPCKGWNGDLQLGDTKITTWITWNVKIWNHPMPTAQSMAYLPTELCCLQFRMSWKTCIKGILAGPPKATPPSNKGWIFGLIKGNQWLINPQ